MESSHRAEYGRAEIDIKNISKLFGEESLGLQQVWMSHGDHAERLPEGFTVAATSQGVRLKAPNILVEVYLPHATVHPADLQIARQPDGNQTKHRSAQFGIPAMSLTDLGRHSEMLLSKVLRSF